MVLWSMRSWESARPPETLGRGSDSQDRMDHEKAWQNKVNPRLKRCHLPTGSKRLVLQLRFVSFSMAGSGFGLMMASPSRPEPDESRTGFGVEDKFGEEALDFRRCEQINSKNYRGIATRYDRNPENFLAAIRIIIKINESAA